MAAARSLGARIASCSAARALCVWLWGRSPSRGAHGAAACGVALALLTPAQSCRRARGGVTLGRRSSVAAARSLGARGASCSAARTHCMWLWGRSPSRVADGATACGASLALLAPEQRCHRARGCVALGRRSFRGGGSLSRRAQCVVLGSSRSLRVTLGAVAVARRSRRRCLRRRAGAPSAGLVMPSRSRRRGARPPLFPRRRLALSARAGRRARQLALSACGSGGGRRRVALMAPLPAAPRWRS